MQVLVNILEKYNDEDYVDICEIVSNHGLKIVEWDLGEVDWMLYQNFIWVKKGICEKTKRFIIAHEFCHFLLKEKSFSTWIYHSLDFKEKRADKFATDILLPKNALLDEYKNFENIPTLSDIFCVPGKVIDMSLKNLLNK